MANKWVNDDALLFFGSQFKTKIEEEIPTKVSDLANDAGFITDADIPEGAAASTATPLMDGTAAVGTSNAFARGDHVHPSDTSKLDVSTFNTAMEQAEVELKRKLYVYNTLEDEITGAILEAKIRNNENPQISFNVLSTDGLSAFYVQKTALSNYVQKVEGKGLSTNDYTTAEKNKLAAFSSASDYALKSDITNMYKYKGSVATVSALPSSANTTGDVYDVQENGMNYAWTGTAWDALGEIFSITAISNAEVTSIVNQVFAS